MSNEPADKKFSVAMRFLADQTNFETFRSIPYEQMSKRLDAAKDVLEFLGHPEQKYRIVHLAGTKGKGSTARAVAEILHHAGYRVGLFTSPHLQHILERFQIDGVPCAEKEFGKTFEIFRTKLDRWNNSRSHTETKTKFTFFEILTLFCFEWFAQRKVDFAVLEVGLGGRFDATNICTSEISVITNIGFDHIEQLGTTLPEIAGEKAGIIKSGVPIVSGAKAPEAANVIRKIALELHAPLYEIGDKFTCSPQNPLENDGKWRFDYEFQPDSRTEPIRLKNLEHKMPGIHQSENASLALTVAMLLRENGFEIPDDAIVRGILETEMPGRIEVLHRNPTVILDGAHNREAVEALIETIRTGFSDLEMKILIFGTTLEKDIEGMLSVVLPFFDEIVFSAYSDNPRSCPPETLLAFANEIRKKEPDKKYASCKLIRDSRTAFEKCKNDLSSHDLLCVSGSLYFAAEIRAYDTI